LGLVAFIVQPLVEKAISWLQVFALDVFDQSHFQHALVIGNRTNAGIVVILQF
jgi:hypothetical protein